MPFHRRSSRLALPSLSRRGPGLASLIVVTLGCSPRDPGECASSFLGRAVGPETAQGPWGRWPDGAPTGVGDLNGDGHSEFALWIPRQYPRGPVYVYAGGASAPTDAAWTLEDNQAREFGVIVGSAGDVNADGFGDLFITVESGEGVYGVALYLGSPEGPGPEWSQLLVVGGVDYYGASAVGLGDVDGDGYDDVGTGSPMRIGCHFEVFPGGAEGLKMDPLWELRSDIDPYWGSCPLTAAGDVDGDGFADFLTGVWKGGDSGGGYTAVHLHFGGPAGSEREDDTTFDTTDTAGVYALAAGDVDGDGFGDIVSRATEVESVGEARVYRGSSAGLLPDPWPLDLAGSLPSYSSYTHIGPAGDVNGDGADDILAWGWPQDPAFGTVAVWMGGPKGPSRTAQLWFPTVNGDAGVVHYAGTLGDVTGDGRAEIGIEDPAGTYAYGACPIADADGDGAWSATCWGLDCDDTRADVHPGAAELGPDGIDADCDGADVPLTSCPTPRRLIRAGEIHLEPPPSGAGETSGATLGGGAEAPGDVNGDGIDDLLLADGGPGGRWYLYLGAGHRPIYDSTLCCATSPREGAGPLPVGDVNGDGYADVVTVGFGSAAYLLPGPDPASVTDALALPALWASPAGDFDGDGLDDLLVTTSDEHAGSEAATVYAGSPDGPGGVVLLSYTVERIGKATAQGAADVNGDGYDDVVLGAPLAHGEAGALLLFAGGGDGRLTQDVAGFSTGDDFGRVVAAVGDINGDGFADVSVNETSAKVAWSFVYPGSAAGLVEAGRQRLPDEAPWLLGAAGDLDDDGYADLLSTGSDPNKLLGLAGSPSGLSSTPTQELSMPHRPAWWAKGVGDVTGEGVPHVLVGTDADLVLRRGVGQRGCGCATGAASPATWLGVVAIGLLRRGRRARGGMAAATLWFIGGCANKRQVAEQVEADMVPVAAGSFTMGIDASWAYAHGYEDPAHPVTLTHDFYLGRTEVTQAWWEPVMGRWVFFHEGCDDCPAENLSFNEAAEFVNALSDAMGMDLCYTETNDGYASVDDPYACTGYRLPTEAEWEYAAHAGGETEYAGSNDPDEVAWTNQNSGGHSHRVCTAPVPENAWGLCDMSGNGMEWTNDWFDVEYYSASPEVDPAGPESSYQDYRAARSGGWSSPAAWARVTDRHWEPPHTRGWLLGLRIARTDFGTP